MRTKSKKARAYTHLKPATTEERQKHVGHADYPKRENSANNGNYIKFGDVHGK